MKTLVFFMCFLITSVTYAGGFRFPNQSYLYAKLYLFNTHYEKGRPDQHIYKNGMYAQTKVGNGYAVSETMVNKMNVIFKPGVEEIWSGLSKCSTPRHGIIFYNYKHQPVASISICFECERVNFWSSVDIQRHAKNDQFDRKKAEKQMKNLKALLIKEHMTIYDDVLDYKTYVDSQPTYKNEGTMTLKDTKSDSIFGKKLTLADLKTWANESLRLKRDTIEKRTMSDAFYFYEYTSTAKDDRTKFIFSGTEDDSHLIQAELYNHAITLPNGIKLGMSHQEVMIILSPVMQGTTTHEKISVSGKTYKIDYSFTHQTLRKVKLYVWPK